MFGDIIDFRIVHHCFDDTLSDFNFSARVAFRVFVFFLDSRIRDTTLFLSCLNLLQ